MATVVYVPWYATVGRADMLADAVTEVAPAVLRYGATKYAVHRSLDDAYKILQMAWFESKTDWYRYWDGPEMIEFRATQSGHYQVPIVYVWNDELTVGGLVPAEEPLPAG